jgi:hypothetical protein
MRADRLFRAIFAGGVTDMSGPSSLALGRPIVGDRPRIRPASLARKRPKEDKRSLSGRVSAETTLFGTQRATVVMMIFLGPFLYSVSEQL